MVRDLGSPIRLFLSRHPMAAAVAFVVIGVLPLYMISAQFVTLERELGLTSTRLGIATALHFGAAAAAGNPIGRIVQREGATVGFRVGALVSALASIVAISANLWWPLILVAAGLSGLSNGFMQISSNVLLARDAVFHRQGVSFGAKQGSIPLASMLAGLMLPLLGVNVGWEWPFLFSALVAVLISYVPPPITNVETEDELQSQAGWRPSASLRWLTLGGACGGAAGNSLALFLVPAAVAVGISEGSAGTALAVAGGMVLAIRMTVGWLADRAESSGHREMIAALAMGTVGCILLVLFDSPVMFLVAIAIAMLGSWGWPGLIYLTTVRIHPEAPAQATGSLLSGNLTGSVIGPLITGWLASGGDFTSAWIFCTVLSLVGMLSMLISRKMAREMGMTARQRGAT